jgi:hypothetical protein
MDALEGRLGPKERPLMALSRDEVTQLTWAELPANRDALQLVLNFVVEPPKHGTNRIQVFIAGQSEALVEVDAICTDPYQVLSIPMPAEALKDAKTLTLELSLVNEGYLWLFAPDQAASGGLEMHVPHLFDAAGGSDSFVGRLFSLASLQTFSWKEGCVLDALQAFADTGNYPQAQVTIREHLDYYNFSGGDLVYETPSSFRVKNELGSIETTLPFAHAALIDPHHPWVDLAMEFWRKMMAANGQVQGAEMISSEGAYTVAYPMFLIAKLRGEPEWETIAEDLLVETFARLVQPDGIYLRHFTDGSRTHRNWVRGLCWQMLGHVQVLKLQTTPSPILLKQLQFLAEFAAKYQLESGLWACFVDESEVLPDTAGSVGVGAAMAMAADAGFLPIEYLERALRCRAAAREYLTAGGYLSGASQSNKGGEGLQRRDYRVTLSYVLGLYGLLEAATLNANDANASSKRE